MPITAFRKVISTQNEKEEGIANTHPEEETFRHLFDVMKTAFEYEDNSFALEVQRTVYSTIAQYSPKGTDNVNFAALLEVINKGGNDLVKTDIAKKCFPGIPTYVTQNLVQGLHYLLKELPSDFKKNLFSHSQPASGTNHVKKFVVPEHFYKSTKKKLKHQNTTLKQPIKLDPTSWLKERYNQYKTLMPGLLCEEFVNSVHQLLSSNKKEDELQNDFIEMLGFDLFELVADILSNRAHLSQTANQNGLGPSVGSKSSSPPNLESVLGELNKLEKLVVQVLESTTVSHEAFERKTLQQRTSKTLKNMPNIYDEHLDIVTKMQICGSVASVPYDAIIKSRELYEEITIPPRKNNTPPEQMGKVAISSLDVIGKMVFKDIKHFNLIQSKVFNIAYNTNENMLVCAPTGSGKTNIALMTIVNQAKKFIEDNVIHLERFKIVYICPMKALAAEMTANFSKKLACLGVKVKELTGDMQLSRKEIIETQMLVTTPEKWDVISRKGTADAELTSLVKLLIIDEVHLLNTDRGPVIEALVARTLRQVITSQNMIRIIGLSATLPSYLDVSQFLRVNPEVGLFYFDNRFRSVPLVQTFVGIKPSKQGQYQNDLDEVCFEKVVEFLRDNHQVLVFVHARNQTVKTANFLKETAGKRKMLDLFLPPRSIQAKKANLEIGNAPNKIVDDLVAHGLGVHHAGMMRRDRSLIEKHFMNGTIKVLVCTATLAWGVNLPAHGVIIKGTEIYDSKRGSFVNLDILDVLQIFGRAGRPQFDTSGHGIIMTSNEKMNFYLSSLTNQLPIESNLMKALADNLNAEIVLGTIANIQEAVEWLTFTYMYRRMNANPHVYGLLPKDFEDDPTLRRHLFDLCHNAAEHLDRTQMIRYDKSSGEFTSTYLGRTASYFYITVESIENFSAKMQPFMTEAAIIQMMCYASEFNDMQVRPDELDDLDGLTDSYCEFPVTTGVENPDGKVYALMQTYLSRGYIKSISLASDMEFINQSSARIARALFDIAIHRNQATFAGRCLNVAQAFERQMWPFQSPVRQFPDIPISVIDHIESHHIRIQDLKDVDDKDLGYLIRNHKVKNVLRHYVDSFPLLSIDSTLHPITRGVIRVKLFITPMFVWNDKIHGKGCENFWLWVEDPDNDTIYHSESLAITKAVCTKMETLELVLTLPLVEPRPNQYLVRVCSDRWMHATHQHALSFKDLYIPLSFTPHTELLELRPLSVEALGNSVYQSLFKFSHFNPVQTQIFHTLYHRDDNVLLGAPTGSGKTIAAEICIFRLFNKNSNLKVVYIAPLKSLVRERVEDWKKRFANDLGKKVTEITGDVTPSMQMLKEADIIITTPEKWDGLSRGWQNRKYIQDIGLIIIDEIHLLGEDRGPVLEVIVSRTNFIACQTGMKPRIIGLSTAMANAGNLANWLGINEVGLYNFRPSVRPVPLDVHIMGFSGKHYCPRMLSMNRPTYQKIRQFAPDSPTLVFCSSRKQTRLTAIDLITFLSTDFDSKRWLHCDEEVMEYIVRNISDPDLQHFLLFGIGIHHAGLQEQDRKTVEELFVNQKIQVLIATATLAWGVNFPAHLVVIKGTEYFDGKTKRYIDMPITDILQMMGRAGRPQFDTSGVACVFVQDIKKNFYKKFLYEPFPIESSLMQVLPDHINAEIASGTIATKDQLMEYMTWTYLYRRLLENPAYYKVDDVEPSGLQKFLSDLVDAVIDVLDESNCIRVEEVEMRLRYEITFYGQMASFYYLSHKTMVHFQKQLEKDITIFEIIKVLCGAEEYATFPVRHNEDKINKDIAQEMAYPLNGESCELPSVKVALLIYAHLQRFKFPNQEYKVDFKLVMDQALRVLQAMTDIASNKGWLSCTLRVIHVMQMLIQGQFLGTSVLLTLPHVTEAHLPTLYSELQKKLNMDERSVSLPSLKFACQKNRVQLECALTVLFEMKTAKEILKHISDIPLLDVSITFPQLEQTLSRKNIPTLSLTADEEYEFVFNIRRLGSPDLSVHAPRFPKKKDEGWFICVGDSKYDYLLQIKRVTVVRQTNCSMMITAPSAPGNYVFTIFIVSDSYLGLDQQYNIPVIIT
ncbi:hypothetical protein PPYR_06735 [Photinus pyralis]|uniref:Activating signal cointegrator 1 complex subunit 3 n=1 Tax=Photinus pyralis TaxID=7054 RepID=A0A1Y1LXL0_PHOPY|nr:activating signal cointegrator 1 complex subunit 3-like [Photinus pyralis]KAB0798855.1 hypothetical protein PPYR_06735 [Photinus pyralis]